MWHSWTTPLSCSCYETGKPLAFIIFSFLFLVFLSYWNNELKIPETHSINSIFWNAIPSPFAKIFFVNSYKDWTTLKNEHVFFVSSSMGPKIFFFLINLREINMWSFLKSFLVAFRQSLTPRDEKIIVHKPTFLRVLTASRKSLWISFRVRILSDYLSKVSTRCY